MSSSSEAVGQQKTSSSSEAVGQEETTRRSPLFGLPLDAAGWVFLVVLAVVTVAAPVLNLVTDAASAIHVPTYAVTLLGKYLTYAFLALSVDTVWGFCGIPNLGHGAFFALGGYAMGLYLMCSIAGRGVCGNTTLPDFMVFLNWKELPWYRYGFDWSPSRPSWRCWCRGSWRSSSAGSPFARG